ncbi:undecaprenyl-diphosphate phosphatase [Yinghuangia sp. ASG 101]|uniref:undecaprenyl-diphosphate phosphatase n=1 Tax=Yinghuangia sp. ASG 101 TaxID=2896848 RepID=UPI001E3506A8|nr:undecaprenyl-diphosphate phosphatase [Yinghuangia sp. ASG 101]UGQ10089.1 undecaprenyl-diphosphate phosphatase [Yinghuangia sp. ASG 101]
MSSSIGVLDAVVLGVVEGLTEFLPVSSTGHLKITEGLLGIDVDDKSVVAFTAVIQVGAIAAVLVYFFTDIVRITGAWGRGLADKSRRTDRDYKFAWWIIYATIPIVIVGVSMKSLIHGPLASLWVVAGSLIVGSGVMWYAESAGGARGRRRGEAEVTLKDTMLVGGSQILALLFPGFSRSGATISTALILGIDRVAATRMSFFLSIPALTGAGLYELKDATEGDTSMVALGVGTAVSFVVAYASVAWLLKFVSKHSINGFAVYRVLIGIALIGMLSSGFMDA